MKPCSGEASLWPPGSKGWPAGMVVTVTEKDMTPPVAPPPPPPPPGPGVPRRAVWRKRKAGGPENPRKVYLCNLCGQLLRCRLLLGGAPRLGWQSKGLLLFKSTDLKHT